MSVQGVPLTILLPKDALVPKSREILLDVAKVLERALEPVKRFRRVRGDRENDVLLAVGVHALNALDAAFAVHTLSGTDHAASVNAPYRTVFEVLVKIRWMRQDPLRAKAYLDSEPFERYAHADARVQASHRWPQIVADCEASVKANPALLSLPNVLHPDGSPNFTRIAVRLRMPKIRVMLRDLGIEDDYLLDFDVPSFFPHTSVLHTKNFAQRLNRDGTVELSSKMDAIMLCGYVTRTATHAGSVMKEVLDLWPDGAVQFAGENACEILVKFVPMLKGYMVGAALGS